MRSNPPTLPDYTDNGYNIPSASDWEAKKAIGYPLG